MPTDRASFSRRNLSMVCRIACRVSASCGRDITVERGYPVEGHRICKCQVILLHSASFCHCRSSSVVAGTLSLRGCTTVDKISRLLQRRAMLIWENRHMMWSRSAYRSSSLWQCLLSAPVKRAGSRVLFVRRVRQDIPQDKDHAQRVSRTKCRPVLTCSLRGR